MHKSNLVVLNGHPDPGPDRFCAALSRSYADGARRSRWNTTLINVGQVSGERNSAVSLDLAQGLKSVCLADRLAIVFPVWLGFPPDCLTHFLRLAGYLAPEALAKIPAHVIATMDMPSLVYRNQTKKNELGQILPVVASLSGIMTAKHTLIGSVKAIIPAQRLAWLDQIKSEGQSDAAQSTTEADSISARLSA